jgi:hypothetical protein
MGVDGIVGSVNLNCCSEIEKRRSECSYGSKDGENLLEGR